MDSRWLSPGSKAGSTNFQDSASSKSSKSSKAKEKIKNFFKRKSRSNHRDVTSSATTSGGPSYILAEATPPGNGKQPAKDGDSSKVSAEVTSPGHKKQPETNTDTELPPAVENDPMDAPTGAASPGHEKQPETNTNIRLNHSSNKSVTGEPKSQKLVSCWKNAFDTLSATQKNQLQISRPTGSVNQELAKLQESKRGCMNRRMAVTLHDGRVVVVRERIQGILKRIQQYVQIVDTAIQHHPETVALVWAGIRFCLQIVLDDMETFEKVTSFMEVVANIMGSCRIYENIYFPDDTESTHAVMEKIQQLCDAVLEFIAEANDYFNTPSGKRIAKTTINPFVIRFQGIIDAINGKKQELNDLAILAHMDVQKGKTEEQLQEFQKLNDQLSLFQTNIVQVQGDLQKLLVDIEERKRTDVFEWLSKVRPGDHHEKLKEDRYEGTGEWLLANREYIGWIESDSSSLLWLRGKAGSGKSVLCSLIKDALRGSFDESVPVVFFYCHYGEENRRETGSVLRSLLKQLSAHEQLPTVHKDLVTAYEIATARGHIQSSLGSTETKTLIRAAIPRFKTIFIVVDALDECSLKERELLGKFLLDQVRLPEGPSGCLVKIFLTSRDEADLRRMFQGGNIQSFIIDADDTAKDINPFVKQMVASYVSSGKILGGSDVPEELQKKLIKYLVDNADGMFLWVKYQILHLCDAANLHDLEVRLKNPPSDLKATYKGIWDKIRLMDDTQQRWAYRTIKWILSATKPLKSDELLRATAIEPGNIATYDRSREASGISYLIGVCKHLIIEDKYGYIRFMHYSVQEFIKEQIEIQQLKTMVAEVCLIVLGAPNEKFNDSLYDYAGRNWQVHFTDLTDLNTHETLITSFLFNERALGLWKRLFGGNLTGELRDRDISYELSPIGVAAHFDLVHLLKRCLEAQPNDTFYDSAADLLRPMYTAFCSAHAEAAELLIRFCTDIITHGNDGKVNAWIAAFKSGGIDFAMMLLEAGANVNAQGGEYGNSLQAAVRFPKPGFVKLLLEAGADVNAQGGEYGNALQAAVCFSKLDLAELLLEAGADVNAQGGEYGNALQAAATFSGPDFVKLLLEAGADVNAQGGKYGNALQAAVCFSELGLVELLLEAGADVNAQGGKYWNALQAAATFSGPDFVKLLLEAGADVNAQGGKYGNALQAAVRFSKPDFVKLLLEAGADVNAQGGEYGNALQAAATFSKLDLVELLLEAGANVNAQGGEYGNALQAAATFSKLDLAELLLGAGADVNAQGGEYGNALQAAVRFSKPDFVKLLLEAGANINAQGGEYGNALQAAARFSKLDLVELLLEAGADVNAHGGEYGNALQAAATFLGPDFVKLLLEAGADVNAQGGKYGNSLQAAVRFSELGLVELLLEAGADVNAQGGKYWNALQAAATFSGPDFVKLLLEAGADVNAQGGEHGSALQAAAAYGNESTFKLLLDAGADPHVQSGKYKNVLYAAASCSETPIAYRIVELLLEIGLDIPMQEGKYGDELKSAFVGRNRVYNIFQILAVKARISNQLTRPHNRKRPMSHSASNEG